MWSLGYKKSSDSNLSYRVVLNLRLTSGDDMGFFKIKSEEAVISGLADREGVELGGWLGSKEVNDKGFGKRNKRLSEKHIIKSKKRTLKTIDKTKLNCKFESSSVLFLNGSQ